VTAEVDAPCAAETAGATVELGAAVLEWLPRRGVAATERCGAPFGARGAAAASLVADASPRRAVGVARLSA